MARWLRGWRNSSELAQACPATRVISATEMEREGVIAVLSFVRQAKKGTEHLVRAKYGRAIGDDATLFATICAKAIEDETRHFEIAPALGRRLPDVAVRHRTFASGRPVLR